MIANEAGLDGKRLASSGQEGQRVPKLLRAAKGSRDPAQRRELLDRTRGALARLKPGKHRALIDAVTAHVNAMERPAPARPRSDPSTNPDTGLQEFFFDELGNRIRSWFSSDGEAGLPTLDNAAPPVPQAPVISPETQAVMAQVKSGLLVQPQQPQGPSLLPKPAIPPIPVTSEQFPKFLDKANKQHDSIVNNTPGVIPIQTNPEADGKQPLHHWHDLGKNSVEQHDGIIQSEAEAQGVDPDLIRTVMYMENARGHKFLANQAADALRV